MLNASIVWAVISATFLLSSAEMCNSLVIRSPIKSYPERKEFSRLECATAVFPRENAPVKSKAINILPCGDQLDMRIIKLAVPAVCNFLILPLVGAVDTFWVGRMGNALSLAGQGAANQVFSSSFWIISFLPSVVTPLVAKAAGSGDVEAVRERIGEAFFLGTILGLLGMVLLSVLPNYALSTVLPAGSPARVYAEPYLAIRALTFLPAILSTIGFAAFRGTMDVITPLQISAISNIVNIILDPLLIFNAGMGVAGAAAATCVAEIFSFVQYVRLLQRKGMLQLSKAMRPPKFSALKPLLVGGFGVQLRAVAMNIAFLAVTRTTQGMDKTGTAAAAHAITIQLWQLGGVFLLAMSTVASIIVPSEVTKLVQQGKSKVEALESSRAAANRLLSWGIILGAVLGLLQIACLPLLNVFSPLPEVQKAARLPSVIGAALQLLNGAVFVGEGIQQGNQYFSQLAAVSAVAAAGMIFSLRTFGSSLTGVWGSFAVFNFIRLFGVLYHHFYDGPLSRRNIEKERAKGPQGR
jgi:multidrug resistance protein, MATE family